MFKHLVLLKVSPWFLYADSEKDALKTCEMYKDNVVGVVVGDNIIVKEAKVRMTIAQDEVYQITQALPTKEEPAKEEPKSNHDDEETIVNMKQAEKELEDEFEKLQLGVDQAG